MEKKRKAEQISIICQNLKGLQKCILFGSVARGDDTESSDMDFVFVFDKPFSKIQNTKSYKEFRDNFYKIVEDTPVDKINLSDREFSGAFKKSPIYDSVVNEGIVLYDKG